MPKLSELKALLKQHNIRGYSFKNKPEIIDLLVEKGILLPEEKKEIIKREIDPKYERLKGIRNNPKRVEIRDLETDETTIFPSMYKASKFIKQNSDSIIRYNEQIWRQKYIIKILD